MTATPITSNQEDQFDRFVLDAAKKARKRRRRTKEDLQRLFGRGGEFQEGLIALIDRLSAPAPDYTLAKRILGGDFVTPEEIAAKRPVAYTSEQIQVLATTLPGEVELQWFKNNGYALMAAPASALSLLDVRNLDRQLFYSKEGGWYAETRQKFSSTDKTNFGWIAFKKTPVTGSLRKNWNEQNQLLSNVEYVPNAAELAWFITTFYEVRGVRLFENVYVRTSSVDSDGDRVYVGFFGAEGLSVSGDWDDDRSDGLGLSSARKF